MVAPHHIPRCRDLSNPEDAMSEATQDTAKPQAACDPAAPLNKRPINHERVKQLIRSSTLCAQGQNSVSEILKEFGYDPPVPIIPKAGSCWVMTQHIRGKPSYANRYAVGRYLLSFVKDGFGNAIYVNSGDKAGECTEDYYNANYLTFLANTLREAEEIIFDEAKLADWFKRNAIATF
jgi:hypothetical protein